MRKKKKKILICEDEKELSSMLSSVLNEAGFEAVIAENGREGIDKMKSFSPDLILLDLLMPKINGFELLKYKKRFVVYRKIPVIVLTNLDQEADMKEARSLGVNDYLVKTDIHLTNLVKKVNQVMAGKKKIRLDKVKYY